ncbi:kinetochore protein NDC80 [Tanacetum coccineum]|uniref:Kinetochore protein NDC80 n=1 Tax=Tanacetum coccineum TaxID=301880 RepID=A0ABQ5F9K4_9ASTR
MLKEKINAKEENVKELEGKLEAMRSRPSLREVKDEEKSLLEKDVKKFNDLIERLRDHEARVEKQMEEKEKQLAVKLEERNMICAENEELKKKVEEQGFNTRDAERMKRELQAVARYIGEAEIERNKWEEKCWDLNAVIGTKWKELEALQLECNQAIRRTDGQGQILVPVAFLTSVSEQKSWETSKKESTLWFHSKAIEKRKRGKTWKLHQADYP